MALKMQKINVSTTFLKEISNRYNTLAFSKSKTTCFVADLQNVFETFGGKF